MNFCCLPLSQWYFVNGTSAEGRLSEDFLEPLLGGHPVHVHGERNVMPVGLKNPRSEPLSNTEEHPLLTPRLCSSVAIALTASGFQHLVYFLGA